MANNLTFTNGTVSLKNITEYPNSFKRQGAFPLERFSVFGTSAALEDYAKNNPVAYVGQILTLVDATNKTVTAYVISNTEGTLIKLATTTQSGDLAKDVSTLQSQVAILIERVEQLGDLSNKDKIAEGDLTEDLLNLINGKPDKATTLEGYGITDAYTKNEVNTELDKKANKATTLEGYGITDAYTKTEVNTELDKKADKATTLEGYGITDAYTKTEVDAKISAVYRVKGSSTIANLPENPVIGDVYNITDSGTIPNTTIKVVAGDNIVYTADGWDKLASDIDLTGYYKKTEVDDLLSKKQDTANLSTSITTDASSDVKYPSVKAVKTELDKKVNSSDTVFTWEDKSSGKAKSNASEIKLDTNLKFTGDTDQDTPNVSGIGELKSKSVLTENVFITGTDFSPIQYVGDGDTHPAKTLQKALDEKVDTTSDKLLTNDDKNILGSLEYKQDGGLRTLSTNVITFDISGSNTIASDIFSDSVEVKADSKTELFTNIKASYEDVNGNTQTEDLQTVLNEKVNKEEGKELSTNDYTDADKKAVAALGHADGVNGGFSISETVTIAKGSHLQVDSEAQFGNAIIMNKTGVSDFSNIQYIDQSNGNNVSLQSVLDQKIGKNTVATDSAFGLVKSAPAADATKNKVVVNSTTGVMSVETISPDTIDGAVGQAKQLETARKISITGAITGNASFDGSEDVSIDVALQDTGTKGTYVKVTTDEKGRVTAGETKLSTTDISGLGDIVSHNAAEFATAGQGELADSAVQEIKIAGITYKKGSTEITKTNLQEKLNFADTTVSNTFTADNTFNKNIEVKGHVTLADLNLSDANVDSYAVNKKYVDEEITKKISASDSMVYRGTLGTGGTITELPTQNVITGDTYKVITNGTYAGQSAFAGDLFIALVTTKPTTDGEATSIEWTYIPSGDDGNVSAKESELLRSGNLIIGQGNHEIKALANGTQGDILKIKKSGNPGYVKADAHIAAEGSIIEITKTVDESTEAITYTYDVPNVPVDKLINSTQEDFVLVLDGGNAAGFSA